MHQTRGTGGAPLATTWTRVRLVSISSYSAEVQCTTSHEGVDARSGRVIGALDCSWSGVPECADAVFVAHETTDVPAGRFECEHLAGLCRVGQTVGLRIDIWVAADMPVPVLATCRTPGGSETWALLGIMRP